ncbi:hypothetical protein LMG29542_07972 [Paraburkholderia humisilvae]|uniref:Transposase IS801/IS1294 domain-containing protein n=1 Tax=Paraburkholderia humisilvae TaxID=627669 RepID=A0A6J5F7W7_9BURK|nr:hypothetical protein LMG29542_07972 [Paraburkholderia humisilvae]
MENTALYVQVAPTCCASSPGIACRPGSFLPARVLSRFLQALEAAHRHGQLQFFGDTALADPATFARWLASLRTCEWVAHAKRPFAGPKAMLEYLSRYTQRVAISNQRRVAFAQRGVTFRWKARGGFENSDSSLSGKAGA